MGLSGDAEKEVKGVDFDIYPRMLVNHIACCRFARNFHFGCNFL